VHVGYGLLGLKIHCKARHRVRREADHPAYVHRTTRQLTMLVTGASTTPMYGCSQPTRNWCRYTFDTLQFYYRLFGPRAIISACGGAGDMRERLGNPDPARIKRNEDGGKGHLVLK